MAKERRFQLISRHQYFDSGGLFISIVMSMPMLFNCSIIVVKSITKFITQGPTYS